MATSDPHVWPENEVKSRIRSTSLVVPFNRPVGWTEIVTCYLSDDGLIILHYPLWAELLMPISLPELVQSVLELVHRCSWNSTNVCREPVVRSKKLDNHVNTYFSFLLSSVLGYMSSKCPSHKLLKLTIRSRTLSLHGPRAVFASFYRPMGYIKSNQISSKHITLNAASGKSSWWAGPTRLKRFKILKLTKITLPCLFYTSSRMIWNMAVNDSALLLFFIPQVVKIPGVKN